MRTRITLDRDFTIGETGKRLYGSFVEHMGRAIYGGIYQPEHSAADEMGFRQDVIDLVKALNLPVIRYPGGNFVSSYKWEDGVGPVELRPRHLDPAWRSIEPNLIGTDEFHAWAKKVGTEVMMAVNLGTRGVEDAKNLLEYCNWKGGSRYSDMRRENGVQEPYNDRVWCLGNEMDAPWQVGCKTIEHYADIAKQTAITMKRMDPDLELVACGSSNYNMPTFGRWEYGVLDVTYDYVDYISLHQYYANYENDTMSYLGAAMDMDRFINTVAAICDTVKGIKHSKKDVYLSFDEWNVWNLQTKCSNTADRWTVAPRREEYLYSMEDALVFGSMLITLMNHADRVKMACQAQLVNVGGPIMTTDDGPAWAQTTYYPFLHASHFGRGMVLTPMIKSETYETEKYGTVPYVSASAVYNEEKGEVAVFMVNRADVQNELTLCLREFDNASVIEHIVMASDDIHTMNTSDDPMAVTPAAADVPAMENGTLQTTLKPFSWNVIRIKTK